MAAAVRSGRISEQRVNEAVRRLLTLKAKLKLPENRFADESRVGALVGTPEHAALVQEVADRSLTLLRNDGVLPVPAGRLTKIVNINVQKADGDPAPPLLSARLATAFPGTQSFTLRPDMDSAYHARVWQAVEGAELVVLSLFVQRNRLGDAAPIRDADQRFLERVIAAKPRAVVAMSYGNPQLIRKVPAVPAFLVGYGEKGWFGNQIVYFDSFVKVLEGRLRPAGKLPVAVSEQYPIGSGLQLQP
jgi:beta-N-acetylhexosaminidase